MRGNPGLEGSWEWGERAACLLELGGTLSEGGGEMTSPTLPRPLPVPLKGGAIRLLAHLKHGGQQAKLHSHALLLLFLPPERMLSVSKSDISSHSSTVQYTCTTQSRQFFTIDALPNGRGLLIVGGVSARLADLFFFFLIYLARKDGYS